MYPKTALLFYEIMKYPVPPFEQYYLFDFELKKEDKPASNKKKDTVSKLEEEYIIFIKKHQKLLTGLPFVENIYLCNSTTFSGLKESSDIDLVIIASKGKIRTVKFFTTLYLFRHWIRRYRSKTRKKFCTSFYLTPEALNLFPLKLHNSTDIYLTYWLAHLVSIYSRRSEEKDRLIKNNKWIQNFLPNHPLQQTIDLGITSQSGNTKTKERIEWCLQWVIWTIIEKVLKHVRLPIMLRKKSKKSKSSNIIIHDTMLKFYNDQRTRIQFLFDLNRTN